jgi:hypothetical protein
MKESVTVPRDPFFFLAADGLVENDFARIRCERQVAVFVDRGRRAF